jgi:hypothetical protein
LLGLCAGALALGAGVPAAQAAPEDPLFVFDPGKAPSLQFPAFEGPCGLGVDSDANLYVSDYYHHLIDVFEPVSTAGGPPHTLRFLVNVKNVDPLDGPCGLALAPDGDLYVNNFHRNVEKFVPSSYPPTPGQSFPPPTIPPTSYSAAGVFDANHPTGVAVDPLTSDVYINRRTHVATYDSSGAPLGTIGAGSLEDAYGVAVSSFPATVGYVYVPDDATDTVKVYDPATDTEDPIQEIDGSDLPGGGFASLDDSAIAVDNFTGEIYVADTGGPQFREDPRAVIHAFGATGAYLGRLKHDVIDAIPPGLAVDNSTTVTQGRVYVTSGNSEDSVVYAYPPGAAVAPPTPLAAAGAGSAQAAGAGESGSSAPASTATPSLTATPSAIAQKGTLRVAVKGRMAPKRLPREGAAPISVSVGGRISTTDKSMPPQLKDMRIELNREGRLDHAGLPNCPYDAIQPASTSRALSACRKSLVGRGSFTADITLGSQEPYPTSGELLLFNGRQGGKQVLFGQIYAERPFATSFVIVFDIQRLGGGTYGTALAAALPPAMSSWGNLTGIEMTLSRRYTHRGKAHSYISAGCPAPKGFSKAVFPLARTTFGFAGGKQLSSVLSGTCKVRGG